MNNQLKLPWLQSYGVEPSNSPPALIAVILGTIRKVGRQMRRNGQLRPQPELGRGYAEFVARRHSLR